MLAVLLGVVIATRIRRRLTALGTAADAIAAGNLDGDLGSAAAGEDEIGSLASSFRAMATQLEERGAAEARLAAIVVSSTETIMAVSLDATITAWNPAAEAMFGYTAAEIIGRPLDVIFAGKDYCEHAGA